VIIGDRLRSIREAKQLSERDIEMRTGLSRSYVLRVETGNTIPSIETIEKLAAALGVEVHQLFYIGEDPPELRNLPKRMNADDIVRASSAKTISLQRKLH